MSIAPKTLNWACGLFATLLGIAVLPPALWSAYWAWVVWSSGADEQPLLTMTLTAYYIAVAFLWLGVPIVFVRGYDRWQRKNGLH